MIDRAVVCEPDNVALTANLTVQRSRHSLNTCLELTVWMNMVLAFEDVVVNKTLTIKEDVAKTTFVVSGVG